MRENRFQEALNVQNACNPSGVARSLVEVIDAAREDPNVKSTYDVARDPAVRLFVAKLADLCELEYEWPSAASAECERRKGE